MIHPGVCRKVKRTSLFSDQKSPSWWYGANTATGLIQVVRGEGKVKNTHNSPLEAPAEFMS
jgi:hypothetical protein